jgi:hypothetical protein
MPQRIWITPRLDWDGTDAIEAFSTPEKALEWIAAQEAPDGGGFHPTTGGGSDELRFAPNLEGARHNGVQIILFSRMI